MGKLKKDFFTDNEVIFVGYSSRNHQYSNSIYQAFANNGIKVYALNNKESSQFGIKVFKKLSELPSSPKCAYVLLNRENTAKAVKQLVNNGVKKILFHSKKTVDQTTLEECNKRGIETAIACPMMILGSGIHRIHGFLAGVR